MKKVIPFEKELLFKTSVNEITAISLEHSINLISEDTISGNFIITGEYKITEASIKREPFSFELPFDIALGTRLNINECVIDIDDFNYKLKDSNTLYVKIDLYIEGEEKEEEVRTVEKETEDSLEEDKLDREDKIEEEPVKEVEPLKEDRELPEEKELPKERKLPEEKELPKERELPEEKELSEEISEEKELPKEEVEEPRTVNIVKDLPKIASEVNIMSNKADITPDEAVTNTNINVNNNKNTDNTLSSIFNDLSDNETYSTYRVYIVKEGDTIDKIIEKYEVDKEKIELYNDIADVKPGDKLIIPSM